MQNRLPEFFSLDELYQLPILDRNWRLRVLEEIDSTNTEALRRLSAGVGTEEIILATKQTKGHGKMGRHWISMQGNLAMTATVGGLNDTSLSDLSFVTAVSILDSINPLLPLNRRLQVKWPNDIFLNNKKLGGILIEIPEIEHAAVVGIGLNVVKAPKFAGLNATCLAEFGCTVSIMDLAILIANNFSVWLKRWKKNGLKPVIAAWRTAAIGIGKPISIRFPNDDQIHGTFIDVGEDGRLLLKTCDGFTRFIFAGDMFLEKRHVTSN